LIFIGNEHSINLASVVPWRLHFDSVCQYAGVAYLSPYGAVIKASYRLEYPTNTIRPNRTLLFVLELFIAICAAHAEASSDLL
jgi:hypothetical protein